MITSKIQDKSLGVGIKKDHKAGSDYYYLTAGGKHICGYGTTPPTFTYPALHNGLCETELEALTV